MNDRIQQLAEQAGLQFYNLSTGESDNPQVCGTPEDLKKFAQLLLANLAEELADVAQRNKKVNPEWANGMYNSAMLAQRMTMDLPQWPEAE